MNHSFSNKEVFGKSFLLELAKAENLYFGFAKEIPIIDYHNHLEPDFISNNQNFRFPTKIWWDGDHYKWIRNFGIKGAVGLGSSIIKTNFMEEELTEKVENLLKRRNQN